MMAKVAIPIAAASLLTTGWLFGAGKHIWTRWNDQWTWTFAGDKKTFDEKEREYLSDWNFGQLITTTLDDVRGLSKSLLTYDQDQTKFCNENLPETRYTKGTSFGKEFGKRHAENIQEASSKGKSLMYHINYDTKTVIYYHFDNRLTHKS